MILSQKWMSKSIRATTLEEKLDVLVWFVLQKEKKDRLLSACQWAVPEFLDLNSSLSDVDQQYQFKLFLFYFLKREFTHPYQ